MDYETRLSHELNRAWLELGVSGSAEHTRAGVLQAHESLLKDERQKIIDEVETKLRANVAKELQQATGLRQEEALRARRSWRVGAALIAGAAATSATMAIPAGDTWVKLSVILATVIGTLIARPRGQ